VKGLKIVSLSLILGGTFLLTGCLTIGLRTRPEVEEVIEVPKVAVPIEVPAPIEVPEEELITTYTVVRGDTLWDIAERIYGDPLKWRLIFEANRDILRSPEDLRPGQKLVIPGQELVIPCK